MAKKFKSRSSLSESMEKVSRWFGKSNRFNRALSGVLAALIAVGVVGGVIFGLIYMEKYVERLPVFTTSEVSVCLYNQPAWMSDSLAREILTESFKPIHNQLVQIHQDGKDKDLTRVLTGQLRNNAWVSHVHRIWRSFGGRFVINCDFREPTALVNLDKWCYLIDNAGYLLPGKYKYDTLTNCGMIEIDGVNAQVPATGKLWSSDDLQAGLKLVKLISTVPFKSLIKAVDVSNFRGRNDNAAPWLVLLTDRNTTIHWGKPVGEEHGLETTAAQKLALLAGIYKQCGHIDFNRQYVDIRRSTTQIDASKIAAAGQTDQE
ncbi:MAG: hypothetical protein WC975_02475 [Phycisphaerae bacterium]